MKTNYFDKAWKKGLAGLFLIGFLLTLLGLQWIGPVSILKPFKSQSVRTPDQLGLAFEAISLETSDGITLDGYWMPTISDSAKGSIIFLHGIGGCKEHFIDLAEKASKEGFHTMVYDARAHGQSEGKYCTYGSMEKKDVSIAIDFIQSKTGDLPIGLWGNSLGGAVAIQALEADERLEFGIIESTFVNLRQIVFDYQKRISGLNIRWLSDHLLTRAGKIANFDPDQVAPIESVKNIEQPVLIAHGTADANISVDYGKALFESLATSQKELVIIEGGNHYNTRYIGGEAYLAKVFDFLEKNVR